MILLREINEEVQITEELINEGKGKTYFIEGPFLQSNIENRNHRIYPKNIMSPVVEKYVNNYVNKNSAWGELGHPAGPTINLERVSHRIVSLKEDKNNWIGKAMITETPMGNTVSGLIRAGGRLGVSSRGVGSVKNNNGLNEVQNDFFLATAADIVADPSAPDAFVQSVMENKEWTLVNGCWMEQDHDAARKLIESTNRADLEVAKFKLFENWMHKISGL